MADNLFDVRVVNQPLNVTADAHVTAIDRMTFDVQAVPQQWEYEFIPISTSAPGQQPPQPVPAESLLTQIRTAGAQNWEAVCVIGNNLLLKRSKI